MTTVLRSGRAPRAPGARVWIPPLVGVRWVAAWAAAGLVAFVVALSVACERYFSTTDHGAAFGTRDARRAVAAGGAHLVSTDHVPYVDPETGLVVLPAAAVHEQTTAYVDAWNGETLRLLRSGVGAGPRYFDRTTPPPDVVRELRTTGTTVDLPGYTNSFSVADLRVWIFRRGCLTGTRDPHELRSPAGPVPTYSTKIGCVPRSDSATRRLPSPVRTTGGMYVPMFRWVRAQAADDGRTLWLRGEADDGRFYIVSFDLERLVVIGIALDVE